MKMYRIPNAECTIAMTPGILDMLTVLPRHKVRRHCVKWVQLKIWSNCAEKDLPLSRQFWAYFDRTWCVKFPPDYWNIQPNSAQIISRANNPLERFNREFNAAFASPHPNLPTFVSTIEKVERSHAALRYDRDNGRSGIGAPDRRQLISIPRTVELPSDSSEGEDPGESPRRHEADDHTQQTQVLGHQHLRRTASRQTDPEIIVPQTLSAIIQSAKSSIRVPRSNMPHIFHQKSNFSITKTNKENLR
jgi:hypothetical protein